MSIQARPMPTETVNGLRPPLPGFPFFNHANQFPFQPTENASCLRNGWWLADASFLVYGDADFIEDAIDRSPLSGYRIEWLGDREDNRGMVLISDDAMIVAFRGTRLQQHKLLDAAEIVLINQYDLWTDSQFFPTAIEAGGKVHSGFLSAYAEVSEHLDQIVSQKTGQQMLWFTGHSLGGGISVIAATHFDQSIVQGICTYGCPRVGNESFAKLIPDHLHARYVFRDDWVPTVPPELIGYRHGGTKREVPSNAPRKFFDDFAAGAQTIISAAKTMAKEQRIDLGELPMKIGGLADHAPIYYASLLWNELISDSVTTEDVRS